MTHAQHPLVRVAGYSSKWRDVKDPQHLIQILPGIGVLAPLFLQTNPMFSIPKVHPAGGGRQHSKNDRRRNDHNQIISGTSGLIENF
jgi:hypothetical protein